MPTARETLQKAGEAYESGAKLLEQWEGKEMPADVSEQVDKLFDEATEKKKLAEILRDREYVKKSLENDDDGGSPVFNHPIGLGDFLKKAAQNEVVEESLANCLKEKNVKKALDSPEYKKAHEAYLRQKFHIIPEATRTAFDEVKTLSSSRDADGGIWVTTEMRNNIITRIRDITKIRSRAQVITTTSGSVGWPTFDYEGDIPKVLESESITVEDLQDMFGKTEFTPHKRAIIWKIPEELVEDSSFDLVGFLTNHFAVRMAEIEEVDFLTGNGIKEPLGITNANLPSADIATASTYIPIADDLINTVYDLKEQYRRSAAWTMHRNMIRTIRKMRSGELNSSDVATFTVGNLLWQPGLQLGEPASILGYPVTESEFYPDATTGSDGDPVWHFGDWSTYWIVDRLQMNMERLDELYKPNGQIGYRLRKRYDGAPVDRNAWKRYNRN